MERSNERAKRLPKDSDVTQELGQAADTRAVDDRLTEYIAETDAAIAAIIVRLVAHGI